MDGWLLDGAEPGCKPADNYCENKLHSFHWLFSLPGRRKEMEIECIPLSNNLLVQTKEKRGMFVLLQEELLVVNSSLKDQLSCLIKVKEKRELFFSLPPDWMQSSFILLGVSTSQSFAPILMVLGHHSSRPAMAKSFAPSPRLRLLRVLRDNCWLQQRTWYV